MFGSSALERIKAQVRRDQPYVSYYDSQRGGNEAPGPRPNDFAYDLEVAQIPYVPTVSAHSWDPEVRRQGWVHDLQLAHGLAPREYGSRRRLDEIPFP